MTHEQEKLVTQNMGYAITLARQYKSDILSTDDLISEGAIGLMKAPEAYKDWNDVILGKRIDGKIVEENGLARHLDDNYNKRLTAFRKSMK